MFAQFNYTETKFTKNRFKNKTKRKKQTSQKPWFALWKF